MKKIKIKFVDFWPNFNEKDNDFYKILSKKYDVEISNEPEFLFYSVCGDDNLDYECIKIFYTGENIIPNFNNCDYGIGYHKIKFDNRYLRMPLYNLFQYKKYLKIALNIYKEKINKREKFCNFIYSNGGASEERKNFYKLLSKYKKIDSGGRYLNNIGGPVKDKYEFQKEYKFSIAFENASDIGYTTEKLTEAKAAGTIPIYWGNPEIGKEFNSKSFINCHEYKNFDEVIEEIKKIDNNEELYESYLKEPFNAKKDGFIEEIDKELEKFLYFIVESKNSKSKCQAREKANENLKKYRILRKNKYMRPYIKLLKKLRLIKGV